MYFIKINIFSLYQNIVQFGRTLALEVRGRRFKSYYSDMKSTDLKQTHKNDTIGKSLKLFDTESVDIGGVKVVPKGLSEIKPFNYVYSFYNLEPDDFNNYYYVTIYFPGKYLLEKDKELLNEARGEMIKFGLMKLEDLKSVKTYETNKIFYDSFDFSYDKIEEKWNIT